MDIKDPAVPHLPPMQVVLNGSQSLHAVQTAGACVQGYTPPPPPKRLSTGRKKRWSATAAAAMINARLSAELRGEVIDDTGNVFGSGKSLGSGISTADEAPEVVPPQLCVRSLDVALVSPGRPTVLPNPDIPPKRTQVGMGHQLGVGC